MVHGHDTQRQGEESKGREREGTDRGMSKNQNEVRLVLRIDNERPGRLPERVTGNRWMYSMRKEENNKRAMRKRRGTGERGRGDRREVELRRGGGYRGLRARPRLVHRLTSPLDSCGRLGGGCSFS